MKLDRNTAADGVGKYAIIKTRVLRQTMDSDVYKAIRLLETMGILDWGKTVEDEFFVMRLKDKYAGYALACYAAHAFRDDPEYAQDVLALANRAGLFHPNCKVPD